MDKAPDAFRTISEVAEDLEVPQHVLRFWETRFAHIRPLKRGGGRRYYRPDDVDLLRGIRHLLYGEGYTIRGVQRILKDSGPKFVQAVWRSGAPQPPPDAYEEDGQDAVQDARSGDGAAFAASDYPRAGEAEDGRADAGQAGSGAPDGPVHAWSSEEGFSSAPAEQDHPGAEPAVARRADEGSREPQKVSELLARAAGPLGAQPPRSGAVPTASVAAGRPQSLATPQRPKAPTPGLDEAERDAAERRASAEREAASRRAAEQREAERDVERQAAERRRSEQQAADAARGSRERMERLRSAIVELNECRRILEAASKDEP